VLDPTLIEGTTVRCNYELRNSAAQVLAKVINKFRIICVAEKFSHVSSVIASVELQCVNIF
jgi:hypothetical protein